jgi:AcrR family transcriptional regulator
MVTKQSRSAPVMRAVLEAVAARLREGDESLIRIPDICKATGVNYGSVYHHFGSREGVIDAAYEMIFMSYVDEDIAVLRQVVESAASLNEFITIMQPILVRMSADEDRRARRAMRVRIVAAALTRPELRQMIGLAQSKVTDELVSVVELGQRRGWVRSEIPSRAVAVVIQTIVFGRTLDDVSTTPIDQSEWDAFIGYFFSGILKLE